MISYTNLFNNGGINRCQEIEVNGEIRQVEISRPMTRTEVINYIKKLQIKFPAIDYQEIQNEKYNKNKFYLKYERENILNEPLKLIPILNKKGINNTTLYCVRNYSGNIQWDSKSKEMKFFDLDNLPQNQNDPNLIEIYKKSFKKRAR